MFETTYCNTFIILYHIVWSILYMYLILKSKCVVRKNILIMGIVITSGNWKMMHLQTLKLVDLSIIINSKTKSYIFFLLFSWILPKFNWKLNKYMYMYIKSLVVLINITVIYLYCQLPVVYLFRTYPKANICSLLFWIKRTSPILCIWIILHWHPFNPHEGSLLSRIWFRDTCMRCSNLFVT